MSPCDWDEKCVCDFIGEKLILWYPLLLDSKVHCGRSANQPEIRICASITDPFADVILCIKDNCNGIIKVFIHWEDVPKVIEAFEKAYEYIKKNRSKGGGK